MSAVTEEFVTFLDPRAKGEVHGTAKLVISGEGAVMLDETGARVGDEVADVTLTATEAVFRDILSGDTNPVMAFMSGKLKVDGSTQRALKVSAILTA